ncbi:hypothetical protein [Haliangium sp.]|uniref:hypothetical protein n=1 Tax=Haliangium sp. TaxID=2663208 RepID=UPI003D0A25F4
MRKLLYRVAWCHRRAYYRRKTRHAECCFRPAHEPVDGCTPQRILLGRELASELKHLTAAAAKRHGGARAGALELALHDRLAGDSDTESARAHGIPREYVNRAKRWVGARLSTR